MSQHSGKQIVLTGGASGMGAAAANRLMALGCHVYVLDVATPNPPSAFAHLMTPIHCNLGDTRAIDQASAQLPERIDGLVNAAGVPGVRPGLLTGEDVININFLGLRHLTRALLPRMASGSSVVNVASSAGWDWRKREDHIAPLLATPDLATGRQWVSANEPLWRDNPYKFSKQCVAAWTYRAVGDALPHGVRVNCVNPGAVETQLTPEFKELVGEALYDWGVDQIGRSGTVDDIAEVIEFLAVGQCSWLNGAEIPVDGGFLAGIQGGWIDLDAAPPK